MPISKELADWNHKCTVGRFRKPATTCAMSLTAPSIGGPQRITRRGKQAVIVVSEEEWNRRTSPRRTFGDLLADSPLTGRDPSAQADCIGNPT